MINTNRIGHIKATHDLINENLDNAAACFNGLLVLDVTNAEQYQISKYLIASSVLPEVNQGDYIPEYLVTLSTEFASRDDPNQLVSVDLVASDGTKYRTWER